MSDRPFTTSMMYLSIAILLVFMAVSACSAEHKPESGLLSMLHAVEIAQFVEPSPETDSDTFPSGPVPTYAPDSSASSTPVYIPATSEPVSTTMQESVVSSPAPEADTVTPMPETAPAAAERVYLEEIIEPCTLVTVPGKDPCAVRKEVSIWLYGPPPALIFWSHYSGYLDQPWHWVSTERREDHIAHLAVRGTALPDTARCSQVQVARHRYYIDPEKHYRTDPERDPIHLVFCFVDVAVQEYIGGAGPPVVTLRIYSSTIFAPDPKVPNTRFQRTAKEMWGSSDDVRTFEDFMIKQIDERYSGSEHIFYILPSDNILSESWDVIADFDIVRNEPPFANESLFSGSVYDPLTKEPRSSASGHELPHWDYCETDLCAHHRRMLTIYEYPEIMSGTRRHHRAMVEKHGGRITDEPDIADLVLDIHGLNSFFRQVGAYSYPHLSPMPPPPVPGEDDEYTHGTNVGDSAGDELLPPAPLNLTATSTAVSVTLTWDAPHDDAEVTSYQILRKAEQDQEFTTLNADTGSARNEYIDTDDTQPGTVYEYVVRAINSHGVGPLSEPVRIIVPQNP